jgi:NADPH:quinone reductase
MDAGYIKAVHCVDHGPPTSLAVSRAVRPSLLPGHARVKVSHCGLGFPDALIVSGKYQLKPDAPFIPGSELAGVVTEVAEDVEHIHPGDRVAAINDSRVGGLAEEAVMPVATMVRLPPSMPTSVAAGMIVNYGTCYYGLMQRAAMRPGETVLVLGAAGGVGLAAVEIAKARGARVIAAAGSEEKIEMALRHGADAAFDYSAQSIKSEVMRLTGNRGVDVIVDPVGGQHSEQALRAVAPGGRMLIVGFAAGEIPKIPLNLPLLKDCAIVGVYLATFCRNDPASFVANIQAIFRLHEERALRPEIVELDCFTDYARAFELIADRRQIGKIVMRLAQEKSEHGSVQ